MADDAPLIHRMNVTLRNFNRHFSLHCLGVIRHDTAVRSNFDIANRFRIIIEQTGLRVAIHFFRGRSSMFNTLTHS